MFALKVLRKSRIHGEKCLIKLHNMKEYEGVEE
jgi:hypothetical protein